MAKKPVHPRRTAASDTRDLAAADAAATSVPDKPRVRASRRKPRTPAVPLRPEAEDCAPVLPAEAPLEDASADPGLRKELVESLEAMIARLRALSPGYNPPPFSPRQLLELIESNADKLSPQIALGLLTKLRKTIGEDLFDVDTWKGVWTMLNFTLEYNGDVLKRRLTGEYETDAWGMDREYLNAVMPFFDFMYSKYWRVEISGLENVPAEGRALLVANHSGQLPWDAAMLGAGLLRHHPSQRILRTLYASWFPTLPFVSDFLTKCGQVLATEENGIRLLEQDELVGVFPEGYKGVGKLYKDRYQLARFGRGGFVRMALQAGAPMVPVAIVGAEETYISLAKSDLLAKLTGFPYFPISPTWPALGPLGFVPLPTKWYIDIGEPIAMDDHGPEAASNLMVVSQLTNQVRDVVQAMIYARLKQRRSVFLD
jgi:1-acyl-sn-glycerol-3-phosphate acyltransferase